MPDTEILISEFRPEPLEALRARYPEALRRAFRFRDPADRATRANVFDFESGMRIALKRAYMRPEDGIWRMVWVGVAAEPLREELVRLATTQGTDAALERLRHEATARFAEIAGEDLSEWIYRGLVSDQSSLQWWRPEE